MFRAGDRVRVRLDGADGFPEFRYGFVGGIEGPDGPALVLLDDELGHEIVMLADLAPIGITTVELVLPGLDLRRDHELCRGLVAMWQAEADQAGIAVEQLVPLDDGIADDVGSWTLARLSAGGERFVLRAAVVAHDPGTVHVRATPQHWDC